MQSTQVRSYIRNVGGSYFFSENAMLANRVTGAWRTRKGRASRVAYVSLPDILFEDGTDKLPQNVGD